MGIAHGDRSESPKDETSSMYVNVDSEEKGQSENEDNKESGGNGNRKGKN